MSNFQLALKKWLKYFRGHTLTRITGVVICIKIISLTTVWIHKLSLMICNNYGKYLLILYGMAKIHRKWHDVIYYCYWYPLLYFHIILFVTYVFNFLQMQIKPVRQFHPLFRFLFVTIFYTYLLLFYSHAKVSKFYFNNS